MRKTILNIYRKRIALCLVACWILWGGLMPVSAEMYRWQSEDGGIQYSNVSPTDPSIVPERIHVNKIPLITDTDGTMYYLAVPQGGKTSATPAQQPYEPLTLPPEVLAQLAQVTSVEATTTPQPQGNEIDPLIERLAALERIVQQEIVARTGGEADEKGDIDLKLALTQMKADIEKLQKAVAITDIHLSTLKDPTLQFQAIESKVKNIQANADAIARRTEEQFANLQQTIADIKRAQQPQTAQSKDTQFDETFNSIRVELDTLSQRMEQQLASLQSTIDEMRQELQAIEKPPARTEGPQLQARLQNQDDRMNQLYGRFITIEERVNAIDTDAISQKLAELTKEILQLTSQPSPEVDESEIQADIDELKATHLKQIEELHTQLDALDDFKSMYEEQLRTLSAKIETLGQKQDSDPPSTQAFSQQLETLLEQVEKLEQTDQTANLQAFEDRFESLSVQIRALEQLSRQSTDSEALKERLETLSTKIRTLEQSYQNVNTEALEERLDILSAKIQYLETQQPSDYNVRIKLAALETEVENLIDALPASRRASQVVSELRENSSTLKTLTTYQGQQLNQQKTQLDEIRSDIEVLKSQLTTFLGQAASGEISQDLLTTLDVPDNTRLLEEVMEKNQFLEAVIKHQTNALHEQQSRLELLEAKYQMLLQMLGTE